MMRQLLPIALTFLIPLGIIGCVSHYRSSFSHVNPGTIARWQSNHLLESNLTPVGVGIGTHFDEVWVIAKEQATTSIKDDDTPGTGAMLALVPGETEQIPLPLEHTDVDARIDAYIATVDVTQKFHNPFDSKIEAVYVFPLPQDSGVNEFVMTIGERRIRGIIRPREQAERIYHEARSQGHRATLLTQQRPNIFTQKVANIEPGRQIDVNIRYFHSLTVADGWYTFVFPMVVGPRFNPPGTVDGIEAVSRTFGVLSGSGTGGGSGFSGESQGKSSGGKSRRASGGPGHWTQVRTLRPGERSGHDIAVRVTVDAGVDIEEIESSNHRIDIHNDVVTLASRETIPNRDFVLRYRLAGDRIKSQLLTHQDQRGGFFTLMVQPPAELGSLPRHPMEMVFVLDCSGSMDGEPITQAKAAISDALGHLEEGDSFQIIRFSNHSSTLGKKPLVANADNLRRGQRYLNSLRSQGGTMMIEGIKAALDFPHDPQRLRFVCFMTDGFIGNESEILDQMHRRLGSARIFSFGVGSSPNRYLLERMAALGKGAVAYVGLNDDPRPIMEHFFERASHPAMTDVKIDWGAMGVNDIFPSRPGDLFVGRPILVTGRYSGNLPDTIRIAGSAQNEPLELTVEIDPKESATPRPALACVWARQQIATLVNQQTVARDTHGELAAEVEQLALDYNLMSAYTAFIAVDASERTSDSYGTTVHQAVPVPDGVRYETTVRE